MCCCDCVCGAAWLAGDLVYTRSTSKAMPMPPLMHRVARPRLASRFFISCSNVVVIRTPVQPIG